MKERLRQTGHSLHTLMILGLLLFTAVLLLFMSGALVPFISRLLSENAIERTKETVLQNVLQRKQQDWFMAYAASLRETAEVKIVNAAELDRVN